MTPQQAENLRILIRHMENNVSRVLNMDLAFDSCGAPACAYGEACTLEAFNAQGLAPHSGLGITVSGNFNGRDQLFGVTYEQGARLFGYRDYNAWKARDVTPQQWAAEARKVLAEHGHSMDDGFAAFKAKILAPITEDSPGWPA